MTDSPSSNVGCNCPSSTYLVKHTAGCYERQIERLQQQLAESSNCDYCDSMREEHERLRNALARACHEPAVIHDRPLSASQRLHNICDALNEQANESPFTREEWERVDKQTVEHLARIRELEAEVSTLREHLAEVNRLMSLNCRTVERLQAENGGLNAALDQMGRVREGNGAAQPPSDAAELAIVRGCLGNLYAAVLRRAEFRGEADLQFAMREARQCLGSVYALTKSGSESEDASHG